MVPRALRNLSAATKTRAGGYGRKGARGAEPGAGSLKDMDFRAQVLLYRPNESRPQVRSLGFDLVLLGPGARLWPLCSPVIWACVLAREPYHPPPSRKNIILPILVESDRKDTTPPGAGSCRRPLHAAKSGDPTLSPEAISVGVRAPLECILGLRPRGGERMRPATGSPVPPAASLLLESPRPGSPDPP